VNDFPSCNIETQRIIKPPITIGNPKPSQKPLTGFDMKKPLINPKVIIDHRKIREPLSPLFFTDPLFDLLMIASRISDRQNA
jgi:hypothetical protein